MFNHIPVKLPILETAHEDNKHFYIYGKKKYPSITTILHSFPNPVIDYWKSITPNWKEIQQESFEVGTGLHKIIENYLNNDDNNNCNVHEKCGSLFLPLLEELNKINNIRCLETPLYEDNMGVAGQVDCIAEFEGELTVIDFKNSRKKKDIYIKKSGYFEQVTFYSKAFEFMTGQNIDNGLILIANWDGSISKHKIKIKDYEDSLYDILSRYELNAN